MASWMGRTALELVGQGALGHSFDPLTADSKDEFTEAVKSFVCVKSHPVSLPRSPEASLCAIDRQLLIRCTQWPSCRL